MQVALVVKNSISTQDRDNRNMGLFSYPVPEFEWKHFIFGGHKAYATEMNDYDLIFQEDAGPRHWKDRRARLVYLAIDSTLSEDHLQARLERAEQSDLILVEQDDLERFSHLGIPVKRFNYCVNDRLMRDHGLPRDLDVSFHCGGNGQPERAKVREMLATYCKKRRLTYQSGILHITDYAMAMARSKIVVNWPRTPANRPHRVFDAMACGACLVTGPIPDVMGDERVPGRDYLQVNRISDIPDTIDYLLETGEWQQIAGKGKRLIARYHTWTIRARQLKGILDA